ncbi:haloacid dehalogenase [Pleomassaria siparia CBS 279.74]|uniref:Haloacid dehalogenase n=1 Tax=Pleomassaria siparia CBS 279.74 TaxID=1314801 RepID=A0A6G1JSG4_9PLEO|nr:haloacid dehalogenase [Pleomassaria siparia CBS 279.74]
MALATPPRALFFDVFGTCVDWRATVTHALHTQAHAALNSATASLATTVRMRASDMLLQDWATFAQQWRNTYKKFTKSVAADDTVPWKTIDEHYLDSLKELLVEWQLEGLWMDDEVRALSLVWHRLDPWPDSSAGIQALNKLFYTVTLSNGNMSLLSDLAEHGSLPFTHIFSAELFHSYKPSPKVYLGGVQKLGLQPLECAMVAAHLNDLKGAKENGLQVIYVERPEEEDWSKEDVDAARREGWVDLWVAKEDQGEGIKGGFVSVAEKLGIVIEESPSRRRSSTTR